MDQTKAVKKYIDDGFVILEPSLNEENIKTLKKEIISLFENEEQKGIVVQDIKNTNIEIFKKIIKIIHSTETQQFFNQLGNFYNKKVSILPRFHIMKNYHINRLTTRRIGSHRDCAREFKYEYSKNKLKKDDYVFGKMGIFLQDNSENYGGAVDVIPGSHLFIKKNNKLLQILNSFRLHILIFFNKKFSNIYKLLPERYYRFFLSAKKINPKIGSPIIFDSRLQHRGSAINEKYLTNIDYLDDHHLSVPNAFIKISIYCYYGSVDGADAHLHGQINREDDDYKNFFNDWKNESEEYKNFDKDLYNSMRSIIDPLENKYKDS